MKKSKSDKFDFACVYHKMWNGKLFVLSNDKEFDKLDFINVSSLIGLVVPYKAIRKNKIDLVYLQEVYFLNQ